MGSLGRNIIIKSPGSALGSLVDIWLWILNYLVKINRTQDFGSKNDYLAVGSSKRSHTKWAQKKELRVTK